MIPAGDAVETGQEDLNITSGSEIQGEEQSQSEQEDDDLEMPTPAQRHQNKVIVSSGDEEKSASVSADLFGEGDNDENMADNQEGEDNDEVMVLSDIVDNNEMVEDDDIGGGNWIPRCLTAVIPTD